MKANRLFSSVLMTSFLCGALAVPALASDPVPAAMPSALAVAVDPVTTPKVTSATDQVSGSQTASNPTEHRYSFIQDIYTTAHNKKVIVALVDAQNPKGERLVAYVLHGAGTYSTPKARAVEIARRLQNWCYKYDSDFVSHLQPKTQGADVVVEDPQDTAPTPDQKWIFTADPMSLKVYHAPSCDAYAQQIIKQISDGLQGISFRDATFDYQLKTDAEKLERATEYFNEGMDAYHQSANPTEDPEDKTCDITVAESKLETAVALVPGNEFCKLQLAEIYADQAEIHADQGDKSNAKKYYQDVADNDTDQEDKAEANAGLDALNGASS